MFLHKRRSTYFIVYNPPLSDSLLNSYLSLPLYKQCDGNCNMYSTGIEMLLQDIFNEVGPTQNHTHTAMEL
jgi:hypothetical protein